jgi:hypothetical protein
MSNVKGLSNRIRSKDEQGGLIAEALSQLQQQVDHLRMTTDEQVTGLKKTAAALESGATAALGKVTLGTPVVTVTSANDAGEKQYLVTIPYTAPVPLRDFGGGEIFVENPSSGTPVDFGFQPFVAADPKIAITIVAPSASTNVRIYLCSATEAGEYSPLVVSTGADPTPSAVVTLAPIVGGTEGAQYTSNVTGFSVSVAYPAQADGTYRAVVTVTFTPPSDPTWGKIAVKLSTDVGVSWSDGYAIGKTSPLVFTMPVGVIATTYKVGGFSRDVNEKENTYKAGVTPVADIIVGNAAGQFDATKFKATTYDPDIFTIEDGKFKVWAMNGSLIVAGTVSSAALNTTAVNVGGGGSKPGKFAVYNAAGTQIGFIGVESGYEGAWFKQLGIGGSSKAAPVITADSDGDVSIDGATITLSATVSSYGHTLVLDPNSTVAPLIIAREYYASAQMLANCLYFWGPDQAAGPEAVIGADGSHAGISLLGVANSGAYPFITIGVTSTQGQLNLGSGAVLQVGGTTVISAARIADFVSLKIGGTEVIDSSRNISTAGTITGKMIPRYWGSGQTPTPVDGELFCYYDGSKLYAGYYKDSNKSRVEMSVVANW